MIALVVLLGIWLLLTFVSIAIGGSFSAPFVPTGSRTVDKMIAAAKLKPSDVVWDIGCGDGRLLLAAARAGAQQSHGIEIALPVYAFAKFKCWLQRPHNTQIEVELGNIFSKDNLARLRTADVIFVFLMKPAMERLFTEVWPHLPTGARVISHAFTPSGVQPDQTLTADRGWRGSGKVTVFVKK